jgi:hypothetical protein
VNLLPLILGALATFNPFIGLILTMVYSAVGIRNGVSAPFRLLILFFAVPVIAAFLSRQLPGVAVIALDAVFGVGLVCVSFLFALRGQRSLNESFLIAAILILLYGVVRYLVFGQFLAQANEQSLAELGRMFPQFYGRSEFRSSFELMRILWPSFWILPQLVALFLGWVLFHRIIGAPFVWSKLSFPKYYNLLIVLALPLYFMPELATMFVNVLVSLSVVPFIQGVGVLIHWLNRIVANKVIMVVLLVVLLTNGILVVLVGFADIWLDFRKINSGGNPA